MKRTFCLFLIALMLLCLLPFGALAEEGTGSESTGEPTVAPTSEGSSAPSTEPTAEAPTPGTTEQPTPKETPTPEKPVENPTAEPSADPSVDPTIPGASEGPTPLPGQPLEIDTGYIYNGMDTSYAMGYMPKIAGGQAVIVLPLLGETQGDVIRVIPEISTDGPFVYGNYQFDVYKTTETALNAVGFSMERQVFLVSLALNLSPSRYNGTYPVTFDVQYTDVNGESQSQSFTLQVAITDGASKSTSSGGGGGGQQSVRKPVLQLVSSAVTPDSVDGAGEVLLTVTLQNVGNRDATNLHVTAQSQDSDVLMTSDLNGVFLTGLAMQGTVEGSFTFAVNERTLSGSHYLTVQATYEDKYGGSYTDAWQFRVNVTQPVKLGFDQMKLPESITSGESFTEMLYVYNPSQAPAYQVQATLTVDGLVCASAYLGTIEAQGSAGKEMSIFATTLSGSQRYGESYGMLEISYQDEQGEWFVLTQDLDITIEEPKPITDEEKEKQEAEQKEQQTLSQWWVSLLIAIAAILVLLSLIIISKFTRMLKMRG